MKEIELAGKKRAETGKKATRLLRKEGRVPCNLYGEKRNDAGVPEALAFSVTAADLRPIVYTPHIYVVSLNIDGEIHKSILKELQFDPVTDAVIHVDFYEINEAKPVTIGVPVKLKGLAQGVREGGRINLSIRKIDVTAPYQNIPETLDIDVTNLRLGKSIKVGELSFDGITLATSPEVIVCSVKTTRASKSAADAAAADTAGQSPAQQA